MLRFCLRIFRKNLWILKQKGKSRRKTDMELVNLMKHAKDRFFCGGSQKQSQQVVWVHVRVSSLTAKVQTWQWRQLPLWVANSFLIRLMIWTVIRTGVTGSFVDLILQLTMEYFKLCNRINLSEWNFFSQSMCSFLCEVIAYIKEYAFAKT